MKPPATWIIRLRAGACVAAILLMSATSARAQIAGFTLRGFGDIGATTFTADQSFDAILGSATGKVFGGGVEVVLPSRLFASVRASRFRESGERVFLFDGMQFDLGISTTITVTPVQLSGGYRFRPFRRVRVFRRIVPYAAAGMGWYGFTETSQFATDQERVADRFTGFHILGGGEVALRRWLAVGGELQWATVPGAIGDNANSVAHEFNENNLGGTTWRFKVVVGR